MTQAISIDDKIAQIEQLFKELNTHGMRGFSGAVWPVIIRREPYYETVRYAYEYPSVFFHNLQWQKNINLQFDKKSDRLLLAKLFIDKHMTGEIDIYLYHFSMYCLYGTNRSLVQKEDLTEASIGKRRVEFVRSLPVSRFNNTDDFISAVWSYQIEHRDTHIGEYRRNPSMSQIRILFTPEQFGSWTGLTYYDADWVEPISGHSDLGCKKWLGEKDPMAPEKKPDGWIEGNLVLGHEGSSNGLRHFVCGVPVHAGRGMQVRFGDGWIDGRYEWSFEKDSLARIHAGDSVIYIREGHIVRIRG